MEIIADRDSQIGLAVERIGNPAQLPIRSGDGEGLHKTVESEKRNLLVEKTALGDLFLKGEKLPDTFSLSIMHNACAGRRYPTR